MLIPHGDHAHSFRVCNYCISNNIEQEVFEKWLSIKDGDKKNVYINTEPFIGTLS